MLHSSSVTGHRFGPPFDGAPRRPLTKATAQGEGSIDATGPDSSGRDGGVHGSPGAPGPLASDRSYLVGPGAPFVHSILMLELAKLEELMKKLCPFQGTRDGWVFLLEVFLAET